MKKIISVIILVVLLGGVVFAFVEFSKSGKLNSPPPFQVGDIGAEEVFEEVDIVPPEIKKLNNDQNTYIHKKYGFTFDFPSYFKTSNFGEGGGEQIIFSSDNGDWFQIYITPWDEDGDITVERIKQDLPDIVIKEPQRVILGPRQKEGVGPYALIFFSKESSLGETREVWFVMNGSLYQITTYKRLDTMIGKVLSTLTFI